MFSAFLALLFGQLWLKMCCTKTSFTRVFEAKCDFKNGFLNRLLDKKGMYLSICFVRVTFTRNISFGTIFKHLFMVVFRKT